MKETETMGEKITDIQNHPGGATCEEQQDFQKESPAKTEGKKNLHIAPSLVA